VVPISCKPSEKWIPILAKKQSSENLQRRRREGVDKEKIRRR
jgi:hypothetical protein